MTQQRRSTLCIVNHNGTAHLARSLPAVAANIAAIDEILLLDNASTDASVETFHQLLPAGKVVRLECNRGPGAARNAGFREARNNRILFIDNDVQLTAGFVQALNDALDARPQAVAAAARVVYADRPHLIQYEGADSHFLGHMILRNENRPTDHCPDTTVTMSSLVTCAFVFDRGRWSHGEPFDEDFSFYCEDHDFGLRARVLGYELLAVPAAVARHGGGTPGLSLRPGGQYAPMRVVTMMTGRWQVILKNYSVRSLCVLGPLLLLYELVQLAGALKRGWGRQWGQAVVWMIPRIPATLGKRRAIQRLRRTPDRAILQGGRVPLRAELCRSALERRVMDALQRLFMSGWRVTARLI